MVVSLRKEVQNRTFRRLSCDLFIAWKAQVPQGFWDSSFLSSQRIVRRTVKILSLIVCAAFALRISNFPGERPCTKKTDVEIL